MFIAIAQQTDEVDCTGIVQPSNSGAAAVELVGGPSGSYRADVGANGYFHLRGLLPGEYLGSVVDQNGNTLYSALVSIRSGMPLMILQLPENHRDNTGWGTVSAARLAHKIPTNARREMELGIRALKKKDMPAAIDHLRKAIALDPEYLDAHNSLGKGYLSTSQHELALNEFQMALQLDPRNSEVEANIAVALLGLHPPAEAEKAARRSVNMDGISPRARYLLAVTLLLQGKITPEVEKDLRQATEAFPRA